MFFEIQFMKYVNKNNLPKKVQFVIDKKQVNKISDNSKISSICEGTLPKIETLEHTFCHIKIKSFDFETAFETHRSGIASSREIKKVKNSPCKTFQSFISGNGNFKKKQNPSPEISSVFEEKKDVVRAKFLTNDLISNGQRYIVENRKAPNIGMTNFQIKTRVAQAKIENNYNSQKQISTEIDASNDIVSEDEARRSEVLSQEDEENENNEVFIKNVYDKIHEPFKKKKQGDALGILFENSTKNNPQQITNPEFANEKAIKISNNLEMDGIKRDIMEIRSSQYNPNMDYLNELHKKAQNKAFAKSKRYQQTKAVFSQLKSKNELKRRDYAVLSKLYLISKSPLLEINKIVTFPSMIKDSKVLADIFKVNLCNLKGSSEYR